MTSDNSAVFLDKISEIFVDLGNHKTIIVAVSGGSDSLALTFLLQEFCQKNNIKLLAVTIDHKMRPNSGKEAENLAKILQKNDISHQILTINSQKIPQKNVEASLRAARYDLLYDFCLKNNAKLLFLGHQLDDIAENFLIRLFRGSGLDGLSPIAPISDFKNIKLVRPLLNFSKESLKNYLKTNKITWFEDETNQDQRFLRNKIRHFLQNFEEKPLIDQRIANSAHEIAQIRDLFDDLMLKKAQEITKFDKSGYFLINHPKLKQIDGKIALKILALIAMEVSQSNYKPRFKDLRIFYDYLMENEAIKPRNFYGCKAEQLQDDIIKISSQKPQSDFYFRTVLKRIFG